MPGGLETTLVILSWAYIAGFFAWLLLLTVVGERLALLFFFNSLAHLAFLPLPLPLVLALLTGNLPLLLASGLAVCVWLYLWGKPLLPRFLRNRRAPDGGAPFSIATYNLLWVNDDYEGIIEAIRRLDTDVVGLQEISPAHSAAIAAQLTSEYPYQVFRPAPRASGIALLSRLPVVESPDAIEDPYWLGAPLIAGLTVAGREVSVIVFHAASVMVPSLARERQARKLIDYAAALERPVVLVGDFNATSVSPAYRILAGSLQDIWLAAGWGHGHTFPGAAWQPVPGSVRPPLPRRLIPKWLVRIDFIFVTLHWHARHARTAPHDGASDHRPVIAHLTLRS